MKNQIISKILGALAVISLSVPICSQSVYPGLFQDKMVIEPLGKFKASSFPLEDVQLLPSRFRDNQLRDSAWMVSIDVNSLVHSFRNTAGVFSSREGGYMTIKKLGGWESLDCDLRGHTTGHLLSAYALMYANTGEVIFKLKADSIVDALYEVQNSYGNGYLSAFAQGLIDRNIQGKGVWAPWYTIHKILSGLIDQYLYAANPKALEIAKGMGDWASDRLLNLDETTRKSMLRNEFGGVNEAFYNLYAITGEERYRQLAEFFYHNEVIDPLKEHNGDMGKKHTNTFIPKVLAEMRRYEILGDDSSLDLGDFFFKMMVNDHTFATGSCSDKEHFFDPAHMSEHLSGYTGETCCSYNMLKLAKHLMCYQPSSKVADYYEQVLYNHILGQQDPQTGMVCYFMPLQAGAYKVYSTPENSFWCCVGSGFENHAKYAESIYLHDDQALYVNLFIPSKVNWKEKGLSITQTTDFPETETVRFTIQTGAIPSKATLKFRYPSWASSKPVLELNGKKVKYNLEKDGYMSVTQPWKDGDILELTLPMSLTLVPTNDNPELCAVKYGAVILAGQLGKDGIEEPAPFSDTTKYNDYYTYDYSITQGLKTSLRVDKDNPANFIKRKGSSLIFESQDGSTLAPLYDTHHQRYVVYWNITE